MARYNSRGRRGMARGRRGMARGRRGRRGMAMGGRAGGMRTRTYSGGQACNEMHPNWPDCRLGSPDRPPSNYQRGGLTGTGAITGHGGIGPTGTGNVTGGGTRRMPGNGTLRDPKPWPPIKPCCFLPQQLINLSDGTKKAIIDVSAGEEVQVYDSENKEIKVSKVNWIKAVPHDDVYKITLEDGKELSPTGNHPFWTKDKDWATVDGHNPNHGGGKETIEAGDYVYDTKKEDWVRIMSIEAIDGEFLTYNFQDMEYMTIIADDILTHNSGYYGDECDK